MASAVAASLPCACSSRIERPRDVVLLWEPRGPWPDVTVERLCGDLDLLHAVDPFVRTNLALSEITDADGSAIVVHAAADDQRTDPSGNSGARVACGVVRPS
jgi:hypothetical protein